MGLREEMVALAQSYNGVSVSCARERYIELLGPEESPAMQSYFCDPKTSGCALTVRGLWRKLGCTDRRVLPAYQFGTAISALVAIARERGAWKPAKLGAVPIAGDFVLVGGDRTRDGGVEHVFTVSAVDLDAEGHVLLESIDGGQRDAKGQQAIVEKSRRWTVKGGAYWDVSAAGSDPGANAPGGRRVQGWADLEAVFKVNQ